VGHGDDDLVLAGLLLLVLEPLLPCSVERPGPADSVGHERSRGLGALLKRMKMHSM
jgi:hypothetical protein